jgi:DNA-binding MarR family transcriptional regulator
MSNDTISTRNIYQNKPLFQVGILQTRAARNVLESRQTILNGYGLVPPEWLVLGYIQSKTRGKGVRVGEIAMTLDVQSTYVTGILRKLEAKDLVDWAVDEADRRARIVRATKKGTAVTNAIKTELLKHDEGLLARLPESAVEGYLRVLEILADTPQIS